MISQNVNISVISKEQTYVNIWQHIHETSQAGNVIIIVIILYLIGVPAMSFSGELRRWFHCFKLLRQRLHHVVHVINSNHHWRCYETTTTTISAINYISMLMTSTARCTLCINVPITVKLCVEFKQSCSCLFTEQILTKKFSSISKSNRFVNLKKIKLVNYNTCILKLFVKV